MTVFRRICPALRSDLQRIVAFLALVARQRGLALAVLGCIALGACATRMQVRSVATGVATPAYELRGDDVAALQAEARRLCPDGMDVMRQWQKHERNETEPGFVRRWSTELLDPPARQAHLIIACKA